MDENTPTSSEIKALAARGVFWSGIQMVSSKLVSFTVFALLSHLLSPSSFGLIAIASLFISFVQIFIGRGFGEAVVQRVALEDEHLATAFWTNLLAGILITVLCTASAPLIATLFHEPQLLQIIPWFSLVFIFAGFSTIQSALLRRMLDFKKLAWRSLIADLTAGVVAIVMALMGWGVWSLVALNLVTSLVSALVLWNVSAWRPGFHFSVKHFNEMFHFGLNIIGIDILNFLNRHADDVLIGYFLGAEMLGYYTVAYKILVTMTDLLTTITNTVALPAFARLQGEMEMVRSAFLFAIRIVSIVSIPAFIGVSLVARELLPLVFGNAWGVSIPVLQVLPFIGILHSIFYLHNSLVIGVGKPSWRFYMTLLNAVTNVIAFAVAVRWGITAVAAAYVIRGYLLSPLEVWMVKKAAQLDIHQYFSQFIKPVMGSVMMSLAILVLKKILGSTITMAAGLGIYASVGALVYFLTVHIMEPTFWPGLLKLAKTSFAGQSIR